MRIRSHLLLFGHGFPASPSYELMLLLPLSLSRMTELFVTPSGSLPTLRLFYAPFRPKIGANARTLFVFVSFLLPFSALVGGVSTTLDAHNAARFFVRFLRGIGFALSLGLTAFSLRSRLQASSSNTVCRSVSAKLIVVLLASPSRV